MNSASKREKGIEKGGAFLGKAKEGRVQNIHLWGATVI